MAKIVIDAAMLFAASEIFCFILVVVLQPLKKGNTTFQQDLSACWKLAVLFGGLIVLPFIMAYYFIDFLIYKVKGGTL